MMEERNMNQKWLRAAERYEAARQPGFKARKKRPEPVTTPASLEAFMANGEGAAAKRLLAMSGKEICLGYSETVMSRTLAVVIDGEGLKTHRGMVGMAAAYSKEEPVRELIDARRALVLLKDFPEEGNLLEDRSDEGSLITNVRKCLDEIAECAP